jgi:hypothetical protein
MAGNSSDTRSQSKKKIIFSVYNFIKELSKQNEIVPSMFAKPKSNS